MGDAIWVMLSCSAIATLDGWEGSRGARIEVELALNLNMEVRSVEEWIH